MKKAVDFKKLVLGSAGRKKVGNWGIFSAREDWVSKGTKGDRKLKGSGSYIVQWSEYQRGSRGSQISARKEKRFASEKSASKFLAIKRKSPKFIHGAIYDR